ncbi:MAG: TatD family hydrolase [Acidobacteriota bacterium]|nr:TatD family hydrolase [Acidobacteriota bacterium]
MNLVDIGINLTHKSFTTDRDTVIAQASEAGVTRMILTGTSETVSREAAELAVTRPGTLYATAGVHPHYARDFTDRTLDTLRGLSARPEVVAVGECGLDFNRNFSPPEDQKRAFEAQLELAAEVNLPLFLHERDAYPTLRDMIERRRDCLGALVVHCFTGNREALDAYLALDCHIGITGWICDERRGQDLLELVKHIPADRLMIETDAPYLLPRNIRPKPASRRNEPRYLTYVRDAVAACTGKSPEQVARETTAAAEAFFNLA